MSDPFLILSLGTIGTMAVAVSATAGLKGWEEWLDLKRREIERRAGSERGGSTEIEQLKKRIRRLEAIATGRAD